MADTSDLKKGVVIKIEEKLYEVLDKTQVSKARGSATIRVKLRNISQGGTKEVTFQSGEDVDIANIFHENMQYLYKESGRYAFMNQDSYETIEIDPEIVGDKAKYLKEGLEVVVKTYENKPVAIDIPNKISYEVVQAPPSVKGNSAGGGVTKKVTLENDMQIDVPVFIEDGEEVVVNTETGEYSERAS